MTWIYCVIAFLVSSYCFYKSSVCDEENDSLWSFTWSITAVGVFVSMFRI